MLPFFSCDIHSHSVLKTYNSVVPKNIWDFYDHDTSDKRALNRLNKQIKGLAKHSQANLQSAHEGNVRLLWTSLYPTEEGFLKFRSITDLFVRDELQVDIMAVFSGYEKQAIENLFSQDCTNYWDRLQLEYQFLVKNTEPVEGRPPIKIFRNYQELETFYTDNKEGIGLIITIEGAHVLYNQEIFIKHSTEEIKSILSENIKTIKAWEYPPFCINLSHHFWNELAGHALSFKRPINMILNQVQGIGLGISELGHHVLRELYTTSNGKRILIDIKHMSIRSRRQYYRFLRDHNYINPDNKIPIICSHTGVTGWGTIKELHDKKDSQQRWQKNYFCDQSINLCDEEFLLIAESEGLVGIMFERKNLGGGLFFQKLQKLTKQKDIHEAYIQLFWDNVFHIVQVIHKKSAWDIVTIGTDYDGAIEHLEPFDSYKKFPDLYASLVQFLSDKKYRKELWFDYTPDEIVTKILQTNVLDFLKKHLK